MRHGEWVVEHQDGGLKAETVLSPARLVLVRVPFPPQWLGLCHYIIVATLTITFKAILGPRQGGILDSPVLPSYHARVFNQDDSPRLPLYDRMSIELLGAEDVAAPDGEPGEGLTLWTTRGDVSCVLQRPVGGGETGVVWAAGARGGLAGPANGLYRDLAVRLADRGIAGLRVDYRRPANLDESVLDILVAVWHMASIGYSRVALVGHSFGGGVVLSASRYTTHARAVAALASQTMGAKDAVLLNGRPLLLVHGEVDTVLPLANAETILGWVPGPKRLVTYPGAGHGLRECAGELRDLLEEWLVGALT